MHATPTDPTPLAIDGRPLRLEDVVAAAHRTRRTELTAAPTSSTG